MTAATDTPAPPVWRRVLAWTAPVGIVLAVYTAHFWINVPRGPLPPLSAKQKKAKKEQEKAAEEAKKEREVKSEEMTEPRAEGQLRNLWRRYGDKPYAREPALPEWDAKHRPMLQRLATRLRQHAFAGSPDLASVEVESVNCRTIRCELVISSPYPHELWRYADALYDLESDDGPVWRSVTVNSLRTRRGQDPRLSILVAFTRDFPDLEAIHLDPLAPGQPDVSVEAEASEGR